jgi:DNA-binding MarR family transcriptional regulator
MSSTTRAGDALTPRELAAWRGMLRTHRDVVSRLDAELESAHGLPLSSYEVLMYLADAGGRLRLGDLADRLLLSRSGLTRLIDRLVKQGLVERERCADDARGYFAVLTSAGRRKLAKARPHHLAGVREHFLTHLDAEDMDALARAWERVK